MTLMLLATTHSTSMHSAIKLYHCSLSYYRQLPIFQRNLIPPSSGQKNMVSCNTGDHSLNLCHNKDLKSQLVMTIFPTTYSLKCHSYRTVKWQGGKFSF